MENEKLCCIDCEKKLAGLLLGTDYLFIGLSKEKNERGLLESEVRCMDCAYKYIKVKKDK